MRRTLLVLAAALALVAASCGDDDPPVVSTTTDTPATTPSTTERTTTSLVDSCGPVTIPGAATQITEASGDADGDGSSDVLRSYLLGESDWHLQVALSAGGGADVAMVTYGASVVDVLGGADVDGDGGDEVWARTGSGASATILGLARLHDCALAQVMFAGGDPAELPVGGTVGTTSGLACDAQTNPDADLTTYTASNVNDDQYEVTATEYRLDDNTLVEQGTQTATASVGDEAFARATSFTCDTLIL